MITTTVIMDIFQGKSPTITSFKTDIKVQKEVFDDCIKEFKRLHDDDIKNGVAPMIPYTYSGATESYQGLSPHMYDYYNNFLMYLDNNTRYPEVIIFRAIAVAFRDYKLPLNQKKIPMIRSLMKKYCDYLTNFFDCQDRQHRDTNKQIWDTLCYA